MSVHELSLEIEQNARERDDFLDITALPGQNGWDALVRKMDAEQNMTLSDLLINSDPSAMRYLQGYIAGIAKVMFFVENASEEAKLRQEKIAEKTREKDQLLEQIEEQEEYEKRESPPPAFENTRV